MEFCLTYPSVYEDYPFDLTTPVLKHKGNKKMFALIYEDENVLYINLKCDPIKAEFFRSVFKNVTPGWHMNKKHWNTVKLNGDVPSNVLEDMISDSYDLTKPKVQKRKPN